MSLNPRCLIAQVNKFCMVVPNIFSIITAVSLFTYQNVYQLTCTKQQLPDISGVHRSLHNPWSSIWNLLHFTFDTLHLEIAPKFQKNLWTPKLNIVQLVRGISMSCDGTRRKCMCLIKQ
jgi:hypothetical protein